MYHCNRKMEMEAGDRLAKRLLDQKTNRQDAKEATRVDRVTCWQTG